MNSLSRVHQHLSTSSPGSLFAEEHGFSTSLAGYRRHLKNRDRMWDMKNFKGKMSDTWTAKLEYTEKHS